MSQIDKLDRSTLDEHSLLLLDPFLQGFPKETIWSIDNYESDGWVIHWLRPAGEDYWHAFLSYSPNDLIVHWGGDHQDFFPFLEGSLQDNIQSCLDTLEKIFDEKLGSIEFYDPRQKYPNVGETWCSPEEILKFRNKPRISSYEVKSWRGTYDQVITL